MAKQLAAVWDIGKTNAKLALADLATGAVEAAATASFPSLAGPPYRRLDVDSLWNWFGAELGRLAAGRRLEAVAVTAHGACGAVVGDEGLALPVYDYEDLAADEAEAEYAKLRPPFAETFSPPLPGGLNYGKSLFWQARSFPEQFARARHILSYAQYWSWMLCGVAATECTTIGSHSDLWRPREGRFSSLPARLGWEKLFPPLRRADEVLGTIRPELAQAIGVNPDVRVACGIHDSNASLLPWLGRAQPFSIASTGTWVINFALGASLDALDPARDCASNVSIRNEPVPSSRWMGGREFGLLVGDGDPAASAEDLAAALDREECMVLPNQGGQGGPFQGWPDMPAGDLAGALGERGAAAAAALYCALMLDVTLDLVASAGDVIIEGSFARNELLAALLATLRPGQDVYVSEDQTGTTNGALRLLAPKLPPPAAAKVAPLAAPAPVLAHRERWRARLRELRPSP